MDGLYAEDCNEGLGGHMAKAYYNGIAIDEVDFEVEFWCEMSKLKDKYTELSEKECKADDSFYRYWAMKLRDANKDLEMEYTSAQ